MPQIIQAPGWMQALEGAAQAVNGVKLGQAQAFQMQQAQAEEQRRQGEYDINRQVGFAKLDEIARIRMEQSGRRMADEAAAKLGLQGLRASTAHQPNGAEPDPLPPQIRAIMDSLPEAAQNVPAPYRAAFIEDARQQISQGLVQHHAKGLATKIHDMLAKGSEAIPPELLQELGGYAEELKLPTITPERMATIEQGVTAAMKGQHDLATTKAWSMDLAKQIESSKQTNPNAVGALSSIQSGLALGVLKPEDAMKQIVAITNKDVWADVEREKAEMRSAIAESARALQEQRLELDRLKAELAGKQKDRELNIRESQGDRRLDQGDRSLDIRQQSIQAKTDEIAAKGGLRKDAQEYGRLKTAVTQASRALSENGITRAPTDQEVYQYYQLLGGAPPPAGTATPPSKTANGSADAAATVTEMLDAGKPYAEIEAWAKENGVDLSKL